MKIIVLGMRSQSTNTSVPSLSPVQELDMLEVDVKDLLRIHRKCGGCVCAVGVCGRCVVDVCGRCVWT